MSNPSFSNIDLWLFELSEGNLSPEQVEQLELFLLRHPELDVDRDVWEMAKVENTPMAYPGIDALERKHQPSRVAGMIVGGVTLLFFISFSVYTYWLNESEKYEATLALQQQRDQLDDKLFDEIRSLKAQVRQAHLQIEAHKTANAENQFEEQSNLAENRENENRSTPLVADLSHSDRTPQGVVANGSVWNTSEERVSNEMDQRLSNQTVEGFSTAQISHASATEQRTLLNAFQENIQPLSIEFVEDEFEWQRWEESEDVTRKGFTVELAETAAFKVRSPREITDFSNQEATSNDRMARTSVSPYGGTGYNENLKMKMSRWVRSVRRMMDNPVALKNSRDPYFHVPGMLANDINFSTTGTMIATRVQAQSRIQWLGQGNEQLMSQVAVDGYSYGIRGGWGIQTSHSMYDKGAVHTGEVALTYSPKLSISNVLSLEPSVRFKMGNKTLDANRIGDQGEIELERGVPIGFYSDNQSPIGKNLWYRDMGVGLLINTKWFFIGAQTDNLFRHIDNIYSIDYADPRRATMAFTGTMGTDWESMDKEVGVSPYVVYRNNSRFSELWVGANFRWKWVTIGAAASDKLEPAASLGMKFDHFSISYNADYTHSFMTDSRNLSHQVAMRFVSKQNRFGKRLLKL